jgi:hypothetical protein
VEESRLNFAGCRAQEKMSGDNMDEVRYDVSRGKGRGKSVRQN